MCTSVPQMDAFNTRISTSSPRTSGTGTSSSHRPGSALAFTTAFIIFCTMANYANQQSRKGFLRLRRQCDQSGGRWFCPNTPNGAGDQKKIIFALDEHLPFWEN